jgi:hypothetical protein
MFGGVVCRKKKIFFMTRIYMSCQEDPIIRVILLYSSLTKFGKYFAEFLNKFLAKYSTKVIHKYFKLFEDISQNL